MLTFLTDLSPVKNQSVGIVFYKIIIILFQDVLLCFNRLQSDLNNVIIYLPVVFVTIAMERNLSPQGAYLQVVNPLCQLHKMVKHTLTIRWQKPTNCVSVFGHFVGLARKGLIFHDFFCTSGFLFLVSIMLMEYFVKN